jgi:pilus assembly protein CpaC
MCHGDNILRETHRFNRWPFFVWFVATSFAIAGSGYAQNRPTLTSTQYEVRQPVQQLDMIVKTSRVITLEGRIPKFQVHNEELVSATPVSENQIQVFAKIPGATQLNIWDTEDRQYTIDISVVADARMVEGILNSQLPFASLKVTPIGEGSIISGTVTSAEDVERAVAITEQFYTTVINNIKVVGVQQVLLHTKLMEVSRTKLRELGIDWTFSGNTLAITSAPGSIAANGFQSQVIAGDFTALLAALRRDSLIKLLAEPTVVATHGRPARFSVGGEVPFIVPSGLGAFTIEYKEFGTSVDFLPFVVGPGRIRLEVRPEVSEPDAARGIVSDGIVLPAFTTRYVETAVEMQSGQTFAIAGLLQSRTETQTDKIPLLGELPYMGSLFRKVRSLQNDIELLITVTPEFVEAMDPFEVPCGGPGLRSGAPSDKELYLKGYIEVPVINGECGMIGGGAMQPGVHHGAGQAGASNGLIYPTSQPVVIGEGVTVMQPDN